MSACKYFSPATEHCFSSFSMVVFNAICKQKGLEPEISAKLYLTSVELSIPHVRKKTDPSQHLTFALVNFDSSFSYRMQMNLPHSHFRCISMSPKPSLPTDIIWKPNNPWTV